MIADSTIAPSVAELAQPDSHLLAKHFDEVLALCHQTDCANLQPYVDKLRDELCGMCDYRSNFNCDCPLQALVPLAVAAIEMHEAQERSVAESLAWNDDEMPESD